jgi:deoxycytidine triphosphate deaminase
VTAFQRPSQNVLTDVDIALLASRRQLIVSGFEAANLSGAAYDLRAGDVLISRQRSNSVDLTSEEFVLLPGEVITIQSLEYVNLDNPICVGIIHSSHTQVSQGVFHPTTSIDPGFSGPLAITLMNAGNIGVRIRRGDRIAKVTFMPVSPRPQRIYGVTQQPRVRQGSVEHGLVVDRLREEVVAEDDFFGGPLRALALRVRALEENRALYRVTSEARVYRNIVNAAWTVVALVIGGVLANKWDAVWSFMVRELHH